MRARVVAPWQALCFVALLGLAVAATAAPDFPKLTGRVVDSADMLDGDSQARLTAMLAAHEKATGQQIVVVTLADLGGVPIEKYGYQLGRHWGIGQKKSDNGALLIVAKAQRKVRIEVGYGLEGQLTDARSSTIIHGIILPAFRQGHFARGIVAGTAAVIKTLGGNPSVAAQPRSREQADQSPSLLRTLMFFGLMVLVIGFFGGGGGMGGRRRRGRGLFFVPMFFGGGFGGGRGGGFGGMGGGGFSGGGGGFGGGGASGGW